SPLKGASSSALVLPTFLWYIGSVFCGPVPGSALELAPSWYEATSTSYSTPSAAISSTTSLTASTGSPKVRPSIAVGLTLPTVLVVTAPITATSTPDRKSTRLNS